MEIVATLILFYLAVGAALFAHAPLSGGAEDFDWRSQIAIFRATFPEVLAWPLALAPLRRPQLAEPPAELAQHLVGQRQRGRQTRRFDAVKIDEAGDAVCLPAPARQNRRPPRWGR